MKDIEHEERGLLARLATALKDKDIGSGKVSAVDRARAALRRFYRRVGVH